MKIEGYDILSTVGKGGMGSVYKARHILTGKIVAIKVLSDLREKRRFENEARIQANIRHPNICRLYTVGEAGGKPYLVMEYIDGESLEGFLKRNLNLRLIDKLKLFRDICNAVATMHRAGIIHRDLKPDNIKITAENHVKILDFGIARGLSTPRYTKTGQLIGSVHYIAPERFKGKCTLQSDVWSLGVILYLLSTGELPFQANDTGKLLATIKKAKYRTASRVNPDIDSKLKSIIDRCLHQDMKKRYRDADALVEDLDKKMLRSGAGQEQNWSDRISWKMNSKVWLTLGTLAVIIILLAWLIPTGSQNNTELGVLCITVQNVNNYTIRVNGKKCGTNCDCYVPMDAIARVEVRARGYKKFDEKVRIYKSRSHVTAIMEQK